MYGYEACMPCLPACPEMGVGGSRVGCKIGPHTSNIRPSYLVYVCIALYCIVSYASLVTYSIVPSTCTSHVYMGYTLRRSFVRSFGRRHQSCLHSFQLTSRALSVAIPIRTQFDSTQLNSTQLVELKESAIHENTTVFVNIINDSLSWLAWPDPPVKHSRKEKKMKTKN
ncbi:hypothetical protein F4804DRAFT_325693 [Jackrogersella minutella]|nr:hypothetical protein F4804DRAFT_325693 [Jackrogersella minutella]